MTSRDTDRQTARDRMEATALRAVMGLPAVVQRRLAGRPVVVDGQVLDTETQLLLRVKGLVREAGAETLPMDAGRLALRRQTWLAGGRQPIGEVRELTLPGGDGPVAARLYVPRAQVAAGSNEEGGIASGAASPLLFYVHGGGMIHGDLDSHDPVCRFLAERSGARVLAIDYRLAPEHRFPAGLDDCWTALQWVSEHADELGADPERIAVGGDSAGGYLSAVLAILAAESGVALRYQMLVYPMTNMADPSRSRAMFGSGFVLTDEYIELANTSYLEPGHDRRDPRVSVHFTEKIPEDLAPAFVVTAGFDPLRDEGEAYARLLADSGTRVELKRYPGLIHGFMHVLGSGRSNRAAVAEIAAKLRAAL